MNMQVQTPPRKFKGRVGDITVNRADLGDTNVVLTSTRLKGQPESPVIVAMKPYQAREFAHAVLDAANLIEGR